MYDVVDAGAGLSGVQVVVADDECARVAAVEVGEERTQRTLLCAGAGVGRLSANVAASLVAYPDAVAVVVAAVVGGQGLRASPVDGAVAPYEVVVGGWLTVLLTAAADVAGCLAADGPPCRAVDDDERDASHGGCWVMGDRWVVVSS